MLPIEGTKECKLHATSLSQVIIYQMRSFECHWEINGGNENKGFVVDFGVICNDSQNTGDLYVNVTVVYIYMLFTI